MARSGLIGIAVAVAVLLLVGTMLPHVSEDAYISFRYAANLVDHGELVFNLGERVEGYTNFVWTLLLAIAHVLGISLDSAARWLGVAFAITSFIYAYRYACLFDERRAFVAPVILAALAYHSMWAWLGLEATSFGCFMLAAFYYLEERRRRPSYAAAAACALLAYLSRPEGGLVMVAVIAIVITRRAPSRWLVVGALAAGSGAHVVFRWLYYGDIVPNTFHAKATVSVETIQYGVRYVFDLFLFGGGLVLLVLGAACRRTARVVDTDHAAAAVVLVYLGYLVLIGGDYMGASRFGVPILPLVAVWLFRVGGRVLDDARMGKLWAVTAWLALVGLSAFATHRDVTTIQDGFISRVGFLDRYVHDRLLIGRWLERNVDGAITVTGSAMGVMPWYLRRARVIDARGLTDRTVARSAPIISHRPGHARFATDAYLLESRPEVLMHRYALAPRPRPREAAAGYHSVCVEIQSMKAGDYFCFAKRDDVALSIGLPPPGRSLAVVDGAGHVAWR